MTGQIDGGDGLRLILHADDYGISAGANFAIRDAYRRGSLTSTSVMVNMPGFADAVQHLEETMELGIGLHASLNVGRPVSRDQDVDRLVGHDGFLRSSFLWHLRASGEARYLDQVRRELHGQFERALDAGFRLDHLNSQSHIHMIPPVHEVFLEVAEDAGIRWVRRSAEPAEGHPAGGGPVNLLKCWMIGRCLQRLGGETGEVGFIGLRHSGRMYESTLAQYVERLPDGVWELLTHPGTGVVSEGDDYQRFVRGYLLEEDRQREWEGLVSDRLEQAMHERGVASVRYGDLP